MKKLLFMACLPLLLAGGPTTKTESSLREGDIVFQSTGGRQAAAIELATHSRFSHVGIVLKKDGKLMVFEGVQPVGFAPVSHWAAQGKEGRYTVMRLKDQKKLTAVLLEKMRAQALKYNGRDYDSYFEWSDDKLYCSEVVWKLYDKAGVRLCHTRSFSDYDFTHPLVKQELQERFGAAIPVDEKIVAPEDIYRSALLEEVR